MIHCKNISLIGLPQVVITSWGWFLWGRALWGKHLLSGLQITLFTNLNFRQSMALSEQNINKRHSYQLPGQVSDKRKLWLWQRSHSWRRLPCLDPPCERLQGGKILEILNIVEIFLKYCSNILEIFLPGSFLSEVVRWQDPWNRLFQSNETPSISIVF